jgi:hypothetical protein
MKADNGSESGRWPPRRCEMPDLSNLSGKLTIDYFLNYAFGNTELQMSGPGQAQFLNFIRLVDKTLLEYEPARFDLQNYVNSDNRTSLFMRCVDHMENCVDSLHRSFLHLDGLRTSIYRERQRTNEPLPDIHRDELPKSSNRKRIDNIRDAIQHMDDRISKGRAGADIAPIGLNVKSDSVELDHEEIYYAELALWIQQIYGVAEQLTNYTSSA